MSQYAASQSSSAAASAVSVLSAVEKSEARRLGMTNGEYLAHKATKAANELGVRGLAASGLGLNASIAGTTTASGAASSAAAYVNARNQAAKAANSAKALSAFTGAVGGAGKSVLQAFASTNAALKEVLKGLTKDQAEDFLRAGAGLQKAASDFVALQAEHEAQIQEMDRQISAAAASKQAGVLAGLEASKAAAQVAFEREKKDIQEEQAELGGHLEKLTRTLNDAQKEALGLFLERNKHTENFTTKIPEIAKHIANTFDNPSPAMITGVPNVKRMGSRTYCSICGQGGCNIAPVTQTYEM